MNVVQEADELHAYHQHVVEEKHFTLMLSSASFTFVGINDLKQSTVTDQTAMR